jgi:lipopolysaccharide transport system ATP-binding protein
MSDIVIKAENLSKKYTIGHQSENGGYVALRDVLMQNARGFWHKTKDLVQGKPIILGDTLEEVWALKDVSFEIQRGEAVGIIGRNGAGKSTLLKILSRITEPSVGRVTIKGRVASLLEVGTGFHPELTGSENIFLNGAILGMTQREIRKKFDEIVAFAEVEKFLDTPVKHYSSGMYVRLAFAIAAHLEPEILIVDEVLAVGDTDFQKKCLGKMDEISRGQGRTILFVSHNMDAILRFCTLGIFLESGSIRAIGEIKTVVSTYLHGQSPSPREIDLSSKVRPAHFPGRARVVKACPSGAQSTWSLPFGQQLSLDISLEVQSSVNRVELLIGLYSIRGFEVATWSNKSNNMELAVHPGINIFRIGFQHLRLLPGQYFLTFVTYSSRGVEDVVLEAVHFEITSSPEAAEIGANSFGGAFVPFASVSILD